MKPLKVILDRALCTGHGRCYMLAPEIFAADPHGNAILLVSELTRDLEPDARTAERNCPECAIRVE